MMNGWVRTRKRPEFGTRRTAQNRRVIVAVQKIKCKHREKLIWGSNWITWNNVANRPSIRTIFATTFMNIPNLEICACITTHIFTSTLGRSPLNPLSVCRSSTLLTVSLAVLHQRPIRARFLRAFFCLSLLCIPLSLTYFLFLIVYVSLSHFLSIHLYYFPLNHPGPVKSLYRQRGRSLLPIFGQYITQCQPGRPLS